MVDGAEQEHRIGMVALAEQIKTLVQSHAEVKEIIRELSHSISEMERRANESCKTCAMWTRVNTLEKQMASIDGRIAGVALAAAVLSFLAAFFVRK